MTTEEGFLRIPNKLFQALLRVPLSGGQCRIVLWVIRQTLGWNRNRTPYTWYRMARDLAMDRGGVVRAGQRLVRSGILCLHGGVIGLQDDVSRWKRPTLGEAGHKDMTRVIDDHSQPKAMPGVIANDDGSQRNRCQESSLFRRAKDSRKDNIKKKRQGNVLTEVVAPPFRNGAITEQHHPAGAAKPIPGKYDGLS